MKKLKELTKDSKWRKTINAGHWIAGLVNGFAVAIHKSTYIIDYPPFTVNFSIDTYSFFLFLLESLTHTHSLAWSTWVRTFSAFQPHHFHHVHKWPFRITRRAETNWETRWNKTDKRERTKKTDCQRAFLTRDIASNWHHRDMILCCIWKFSNFIVETPSHFFHMLQHDDWSIAYKQCSLTISIGLYRFDQFSSFLFLSFIHS